MNVKRQKVVYGAMIGAAALFAGLLSPGIAAAAKPKVVIADYFTPSDKTDYAVMDGLVKQFAAANPDLDVVHQTYPYGDLTSGKMLTLLLNNEAPTVFLMPNVYTLSYAGKGFLLDLTNWIQDSAWIHQDFIDPVLGANKDAGGRIWGIPQGLQMEALFYNTQMFDDAGVAYPDDSWTWQTAADAAKKLTKQDGTGKVTQYGAAFEPGYGYAGWSMFKALGGQAFTDQGRKATIDSPAATQMMQYMRDGVQSNYFVSASSVLLKIEAMGVQQYNYLARIKGNKTPFNVAAVPKGPEGRFAPTIANSWVIAKGADSASQQAAWRWIQFYSAVGPQVKWALEGDAAPANREAASQVFAKSNTDPSNLKVFVEQMNNVDWMANNPVWNDWFFGIWCKILKDGQTGKLSITQAIANVQSKTQALLDDYYKKQPAK